MKNKKYLLIILAVFLMTSGFSCKIFSKNNIPQNLTNKINLNYWGVWEENADLEPIINDFQTLHPNITITYRKFRYQEYQQKLLEAWAEDRGPDLYSLPVEWLKNYKTRITPQPESVQLAFQEAKKTLGKVEINTVVRQVPIFKPYDIKSQFVETVYNDVIIDGKVYALPLSVDTLALFYNRDLLDGAGVATPPTNWTEVKETVKKTVTLDAQNNIVQAGIALGTADNISRAIDIVALLMMQNGTQMITGNQVSFQNPPAGSNSQAYLPGLEALKFYTDFADPIKEVYSWNNNMPDALESFTAGKLAMMYGYSYQLPVIIGRAPKLNIGVAPMTQIQGATAPLNYTNYWVTAVAHKTISAEAAWGFLNFLAGEQEIKKYLAITKRSAALRSLINEQKNDPALAVFANQSLTAKHWYTGNDALKMEEIFLDLITNFPKTKEPQILLQNAAAQINLTL